MYWYQKGSNVRIEKIGGELVREVSFPVSSSTHIQMSRDCKYAVITAGVITLTPKDREWTIYTCIWDSTPKLLCTHHKKYSKGDYVWMCSVEVKWNPVRTECIINYPNNIEDAGSSFIFTTNDARELQEIKASHFKLTGWDSLGNVLIHNSHTLEYAKRPGVHRIYETPPDCEISGKLTYGEVADDIQALIHGDTMTITTCKMIITCDGVKALAICPKLDKYAFVAAEQLAIIGIDGSIISRQECPPHDHEHELEWSPCGNFVIDSANSTVYADKVTQINTKSIGWCAHT
jgi:hypothetical protein